MISWKSRYVLLFCKKKKLELCKKKFLNQNIWNQKKKNLNLILNTTWKVVLCCRSSHHSIIYLPDFFVCFLLYICVCKSHIMLKICSKMRHNFKRKSILFFKKRVGINQTFRLDIYLYICCIMYIIFGMNVHILGKFCIENNYNSPSNRTFSNFQFIFTKFWKNWFYKIWFHEKNVAFWSKFEVFCESLCMMCHTKRVIKSLSVMRKHNWCHQINDGTWFYYLYFIIWLFDVNFFLLLSNNWRWWDESSKVIQIIH